MNHKNIRLFLSFLIVFAGARSAFTQLIGDEIEYSIFSFKDRDRDAKFFSLRLDALQLNLPVEDGTNKIGLDQWADNRAGLTQDEKKRALPALGFIFGDQQQGVNKTDINATQGGLYGATLQGPHAAELDFSYISFTNDANQAAGNTKSEYLKPVYGLGYGYSSGNFLIGARANFNSANLETTNKTSNAKTADLETAMSAFGVGVGYRFPMGEHSATAGATLDLRGDKSDLAIQVLGFDVVRKVSLSGPQYGVHTVFDFADSGRLGVRYLGSSKSDDAVEQKVDINANKTFEASEITKFKDDASYNEIGVRGLYKLSNVPVNLGLEYVNSTDETKEKGTSGSTNGQLVDHDKITGTGLGLGVAYRLMEDKGLVGLEFQSTDRKGKDGDDTTGDGIVDTYITNKIAGTSYALGGEYKLADQWTGRLSYKYFLDKNKPQAGTAVETKINTIGAGVGFQPTDKLKADLLFANKSFVNNQTTKKKTAENTVSLLLNFYF